MDLTVVEVCNAIMPPSAVDRQFLDVGGASGRTLAGLPDPYVQIKMTRDKRNEAGALVMDQIGATRRCEYKSDTATPTFRFHADMGVQAEDDDVLVVELWDYDTFTGDDFLGMALVRVRDLEEAPKGFQVFAGRMEQHGSDKVPDSFDPDWLSKVVEMPSDGAPDVPVVTLRRCRRRGSGSEDTPGRENPIPSRLAVYFLRHGESKWNHAQAHLDAIGMYGDVDHSLDEEGIKQCQEFNEFWKDQRDGTYEGDRRTAADLDEFLSADAIYASPLCRAMQTCLIALDGHPALRADALKPQVTLLSSAREVKHLTGMDVVAAHVGDAIFEHVQDKTTESLGAEETDRTMGHVEVDAYDTEDKWWTTAEDHDRPSDLLARFYSFVSSLRFSHRSGVSDKPIIVVGHSLFLREFCRYFMDPDLAEDDPIAHQLTQHKLANAAMVRLDLEFDDAELDELVRIVGVTPVFGMKFVDHEGADSIANSLADLFCCCCRKPEADGSTSTTTSYQNPMDEPVEDHELRMSRRTPRNSGSESPGVQ